MPERHDLLTVSVRITANKPLTEKQWQKIHSALAESFEERIAEREDFTAQIGHVFIGSPWGYAYDKEICP